MSNIPIISNSIKPRTQMVYKPDIPLHCVQKLDPANCSISKYNRYTCNLHSLAWEHHLQGLLEEERELQNNKNCSVHQNYLEGLIQTYKKSEQTAQDLAKIVADQFLTQQLLTYERLKLQKAKVRARINSTIQSATYKKNEEQLKWKFDLRRLFHQIRETIQHILNADGEKQFQRLQFLIDSKKNLTSEFLLEMPRKTATQILEYLSQVRLMLSKKTDEVLVLKEIHGQDFIYDDYTVKDFSQSIKSGDDTQSVLSSRLSISRSQSQKKKRREDEKKIEKYYDLDKLKLKLHNADMNQIKAAVRRIMVKETLSEAEQIRAKQYRYEQEKIEKLKNSSPIMKKLYERKQKEIRKKQITERKRVSSAPTRERVNYLNNKLFYKKEPKQKVNFRGEIIGIDPNQERKLKQKQQFTKEYNLNNTVGECFNAATQYNNLFFIN